MPSSSYALQPYTAKYIYPSGQEVPIGQVGYGLSGNYSREDTVRRLRPADLFASGTGRTASKTDVTQTIGSQHVGGNTFLRAYCNYWVTASAPPGGWMPSAGIISRTHGKLLAKIKDQNVNLAQALAEYRQTSSMFVSLARDVWSTFRSLRSGRAFSDFIRILQTPRSKNEQRLANRWLQYQYGLKPLMSDIYGSVEMLNQRLNAGIYIYVSASSREDNSVLFKIQNSFDCRTFETLTYRVRARYMITNTSIKTLTQVGITNPLLLVWELIPYSFVVDWLFPVGQWLSSLDALNGTSNLRYYGTTRSERLSTAEAFGARNQLKMLSYGRTQPQTALSMPKLTYQPSTTLTKVANGLALLTQLRSKR